MCKEKAAMKTGDRKQSLNLSALNGALETEGLGEIGCGPLCRVNYLSQRGNKFQLAKILVFVFIPLAGVWGFTLFSLYDSLQTKADFESNMEVWPPEFSTVEQREYRTKHRLMSFISQHRKHLDPALTDTYQEIKFYSAITQRFMDWMIENIRDTGFGAFWKSLVAYQKLTRCNLDAGAERAYGVMFYTRGDFFSFDEFELYNKRVHSFKIHYQSAVSYSPLVYPLLDNESSEVDATLAINTFRREIRNADLNQVLSYKSLEKAEWLFDNMTIRIDSLFALQEEIADKIDRMLDDKISEIGVQIAIYAIIVCLAIAICPLIVFYSEFLTSSIARYSKILLEKSSELDEEKSKSETILYQMIPKTIAERLKKSSNVDSEFFRSVTLMFSSIVNFTKLTVKFSPMELVDTLNYLYTYFDQRIEDYDVYKVETINDTYLLASGLPLPNGDRHVSEIASFAVDITRMVNSIAYSRSMHGEQLQLLVGISTGPVSAGVIGTVMLRYCVFGDTVNIASRMMSNGAPNRIHISESTYKKLKKNGNFRMQSRGVINVKGKGQMNTFWLLDSCDNDKVAKPYHLPGQTDGVREMSSLGSVAEEPPAESHSSEIKYEPEPETSGSGRTMPTRRLSYSAMHVCQNPC